MNARNERDTGGWKRLLIAGAEPAGSAPICFIACANQGADQGDGCEANGLLMTVPEVLLQPDEFGPLGHPQ